MIVRPFIFFLICLTALKIFAVYLTTFSLFGDEAQYWLWSKDLDFGYLSKPPLIAWVISLYTSVFGDSFESLKLFSIFFYFFTSFVIYRFCRLLDLQKSLALICTISFLIMPAVSVSSFLLTTDILLLFFWTVSMCVLINIKKNPSTGNFLIFGIVLGLAFLAKYAAIYFFISLVVLFLLDNNLRNIFSSNKSKLVLFLLLFVLSFCLI